jgi:glycerate 2-kinase
VDPTDAVTAMDLKDQAVYIFLQSLQEVDIDRTIKEKLRVEDDTLFVLEESLKLSSYKQIVVIGIGKASLKMGNALKSLLGDKLDKSLLVSDRRHPVNLDTEIIIAGHPIPNRQSLLAGQRIVELLRSCDEFSLIIFLISGGGSSLVELLPSPQVTLEDIQNLNRVLITCGASIHEINVIRKHLSGLKGGRLGLLTKRCRLLAIYISDVNPGDLRAIASNPLLPDEASLDDFYEVLRRYDLIDKLPGSIVKMIERGQILGLPSAEEINTERITTLVLLDNTDVVKAAYRAASQLGFHVEAAFDLVEGNYREVADELLERMARLQYRLPNRPVAIVSGGEVLCPVHGFGIGGRNQEFVLYCAARLAANRTQSCVLSCGTDGIDGNSVAAGAVADQNTVITAGQHGVDARAYLEHNDSHSFFKKVGGLVVTGPTGNNIRDVRVLLTAPCRSD